MYAVKHFLHQTLHLNRFKQSILISLSFDTILILASIKKIILTQPLFQIDKERRGVEMRLEERREEERNREKKKGLNLVEVARVLHLALIICNQTLSLSSLPSMS